jgi:hypothetical protein
MPADAKMSTVFDKTTQNVVLKYETTNITTVFKIVCDQLSAVPSIKVSSFTYFSGLGIESRDCIFSCVRPFYEGAVSDLDP